MRRAGLQAVLTLPTSHIQFDSHGHTVTRYSDVLVPAFARARKQFDRNRRLAVAAEIGGPAPIVRPTVRETFKRKVVLPHHPFQPVGRQGHGVTCALLFKYSPTAEKMHMRGKASRLARGRRFALVSRPAL